MTNSYNFSRNALLKRIGLSPGKKLLVFFISLVAVTIPMGHVYNSIAIIFFVLYSVLSARPQDFSWRFSLLLPILLFALMALSLCWSLNIKSSLMALSKEAPLLFIPLAFLCNRRLSRHGANDILKKYSIAMCLFAAYFFCRALFKYIGSGNSGVFFHNELATPLINAVYLAALFSLALFVFISKKKKTFWGFAATGFLLAQIILLSVKSVIIIDVLLILSYYLFFSGLPKKAMVTAVCVFCLLTAGLAYYGRVYDSFVREMQPVAQNEVADTVHNVTVGEALQRPQFAAHHNFNAAAFRAYQFRIFTEMLAKDHVFLTGYGLNASAIKIEQKGVEHNLYHKNEQNIRYNRLNFHNQYIEAFADLGVFGFILVLLAVLLNLKNGLRAKYFVHIAFAVLMISLFLTESFLWRQKGVVFFTVFYCLFNALLPNGHRKSEL